MDDGRFRTIFQYFNVFHFHIVMDGHSIRHIAETRLIGIHIMRMVLVIIYDGFSKIQFVAVFAAHIQETLVPIIIYDWVKIGIDTNGVFLFEYLVNPVLEKIIVRFQMMRNERIWVFLEEFIYHFPYDFLGCHIRYRWIFLCDFCIMNIICPIPLYNKSDNFGRNTEIYAQLLQIYAVLFMLFNIYGSDIYQDMPITKIIICIVGVFACVI